MRRDNAPTQTISLGRASSVRGGFAPGRRCGLRARAFSLLEILIVIGVIAMLLALMAPALHSCRAAGRNLKCVSQLQKVTFDFRIFADDFAVLSRGGSDTALGEKAFYLEDFQESVYRVDEFWDAPNASSAVYDSPKESMMCPEGPTFLQRRAGRPCSSGAVLPFKNVSFAFNRRLYRPGPSFMRVALSSRILEYADVPLVFDVDGAQAAAQGQIPYYSAPPARPDDGYDGGRFWFPSFRHAGKFNAAFVDGHVASSSHPTTESAWRWAYQPE